MTDQHMTPSHSNETIDANEENQVTTTITQLIVNGGSNNDFETRYFAELITGVLKDPKYAENEDARRAKVVGSTNRDLMDQLNRTVTPSSTASFRFWQTAKRASLFEYATLLSRYDDLVLLTVTPKSGGIHAEETDPNELRDELIKLQRRLNAFFDKITAKQKGRVGYFGCVELSNCESGKIQPHAHILCKLSHLKGPRRYIKTKSWDYNVHEKRFDSENSIPENCVDTISYILKNTTFVKRATNENPENENRSNAKRPPVKVERLILETMHRLDVSDFIIAKRDNHFDAVLEKIRRKTSRRKRVRSEKQCEHNRKRAKTTGNDCSTVATDRIGSQNWSNVYEFARQNASKHVEKFPENVKRETINGRDFDAAFLCRSIAARFYLLRPSGGSWEILRIGHRSDDLEAQLNAAKIDILSSSSINKLKNFLERLTCLDFPIGESTSGLVHFETEGNESRFAFIFDGEKYCGHLGQATWSLPKIETASPQKRTPLGAFEPWHVKIAPHVRGMPVATAIIAYALSVPLRQLDAFRRLQIDQATMVLAGASSSGKTSTALSLAQGLMAEPGAAENFNATVNALNERCALYQGRCMVVDDLSSVSQSIEVGPDKDEKAKRKRLQVLAEFLRRVATGQDKARHRDAKAMTSTVGCIVSANDLPGDFGQSDQEQINMLKARSIQFNCGENDQLLNPVGLAPEIATEKVKAAADANYGWIGLHFNEALCKHLNHDLEGTTSQLLDDFDKFRSKAASEFPQISAVGKRVVKQFALMFATWRFANRTNVLPASIWGTPDRPIFEALKMALENAGLDQVQAQSGPKSTANSQTKWPQARLERRVVALAKRKPDLFINSTVRPFPMVSDHRAEKSVFITKARKDGHQIAIKKESFLQRVLPGIGDNELRTMREDGRLKTSDRGSLTTTKPLRQSCNEKGKKKPSSSERCYLLKVSDSCVDEIVKTLNKDAGS